MRTALLPGSVERRFAPRTPAKSKARVTFGHGTQFRDCVITNISATGACLRLKDNETIPDEGVLVDRDAQTSYEFQVVWRVSPLVAVAFTSVPAPTAH
ncbi:MAG TPA: PilZ domain-containing protein [Rhizomicrobium sp.]